jgi:sugar phosphate isomerase/epimerase
MIDRRTFLFQGAALAASGCVCPFGRCNAGSVYSGIPVGVITYSYRSMPVGAYKTLEYVKASGLSEIELMGNDLELDAGAPMNKLFWKMSKAEKAQVSAWRKTVDMKRFEAVRDKYEASGVKAHIVKFGNIGASMSQTDDEIEYCFKVAKAMGAGAITREIPDPKKFAAWKPIALRLAKFAEKYDIAIAFHNHLQINATTYDGPLLDWSPKFMINLDIGHYVAANDDDPLAVVKKYHDRIYSMHIKDRTSTAHGRKNLAFGKGDTPLKGLFDLMKREGYRFPRDIELEYRIPAGSNAVREVDVCRRYCKSAIA